MLSADRVARSLWVVADRCGGILFAERRARLAGRHQTHDSISTKKMPGTAGHF